MMDLLTPGFHLNWREEGGTIRRGGCVKTQFLLFAVLKGERVKTNTLTKTLGFLIFLGDGGVLWFLFKAAPFHTTPP